MRKGPMLAACADDPRRMGLAPERRDPVFHAALLILIVGSIVVFFPGSVSATTGTLAITADTTLTEDHQVKADIERHDALARHLEDAHASSCTAPTPTRPNRASCVPV